MNLCDRHEIQALLERHGFRFSKSMGQNFLIESRVPRDIADACGADGDTGVLEIGPGIGPLTAELARRAGKVVSVELDRRLYPVLAETMAGFDNFTLIPGDVMDLDLPALIAEHFGGLRPILCANLPYNITTPVLTKCVESRCFDSLTVLIQKEVAQRICADPGTPEYGSFTVFSRFYSRPKTLFDVPPGCFMPQPKVTSTVISLAACGRPAGLRDEKLFFRIVRAAFAQRRKTLVNCLNSSFNAGKEELSSLLSGLGINALARGETLGIDEFVKLSNALGEIIDNNRN
jgi:16S rRNA (adenine1518-N6/adenine1519-N6)-dimethyltransferase